MKNGVYARGIVGINFAITRLSAREVLVHNIGLPIRCFFF